MTIAQVLVWVGSVAFLCVWVALWGVIATGSLRAGARYLRLWLGVMVGTLAVGAVVFMLVAPLTPG